MLYCYCWSGRYQYLLKKSCVFYSLRRLYDDESSYFYLLVLYWAFQISVGNCHVDSYTFWRAAL